MPADARTLPLVSIGLPVYNGENFIRQAIESVLSQSYNNLELVISDNGSIDGTPEICRSFAEKDKRIRVHTFDRNCGASRNYNKTFELSTGKYFRWLAHDDMLAPGSLESAVEVLESDPSVILCGSAKRNLNADNEEIDTVNFKGLHLADENPVERYRLLLRHFSRTFTEADMILTSLIRREVLKDTILIANYTSADFTLLADLILKGKFKVLEHPYYLRRIHHGISTSVYNNNPSEAGKIDPKNKIKHKSHAEIAKWYDPNGKIRRIPHITWLKELLNSIEKNHFPKEEKNQLKRLTWQWFVKRTSVSVNDKFKRLIQS